MSFRTLVVAVLFIGIAQLATNMAANSAEEAPTKRHAMILGSVDETQLSPIERSTPAAATQANDRGALPDNQPITHMQIFLHRSPAAQQALDAYTAQLTDPASPNFHRWLTPDQYGAEYGAAESDIATISAWIASKGFSINKIYPNRLAIDFSGTAGQVRSAFKTEIHHLDVHGAPHVANMTDPYVPSALRPAIAGIIHLDDIGPTSDAHTVSGYTTASGNRVAPADFATIYNLNPLFVEGITGKGQNIVVIEQSDLASISDWQNFASIFIGANATGQLHASYHPGGCTDPGVASGTVAGSSEPEAMFDAEWSYATAPGADIYVASCQEGVSTTIQNVVNDSLSVSVMSLSVSACESAAGQSFWNFLSEIYQQAASEGISIFVSAGDNDGATCDQNNAALGPATTGLQINGFASTPYNVAVGGTDFADTYTDTSVRYWKSTNAPNLGSAVTYIPEIPWNDSCASQLVATYLHYTVTWGTSGFCNSSQGTAFANASGGAGGASQIVSKPSWQAGTGVPADGKRDIPDVALFAGAGSWGHAYVACDSTLSGATCTASQTVSVGGTSLSAPALAGIQALVDQKNGGKQGNPNPTYYSLAKSEYATPGGICNASLGNAVGSQCVFYDVTMGDDDGACTGSANCFLPSGTYGVLSLSDSAYQPAYQAGAGFDLATGLGSVNAYNLATQWATTGTPALLAGAIFSTAQGSSESFLRFFNTGTAAGTVTVSLSDYATGNHLGQWTSDSIPANGEFQYFIGTIESAVGITNKPSYYSIAVQSSMTGYFEHVLYRPANGTLTNLSTCAAGVTANPTELSGVHTSTLGGIGFPSTIVVNNTSASAETVTLNIYDARNGDLLGTYATASIAAGGQAIVPVATIEAATKITPTSSMDHYVVEAQSPFTGYLQNLVNNTQAGVTTDMTTVCSLNGSAWAGAKSPLQSGAVYSSAQTVSQSFLRFFNTGTTTGTASVTLKDYASGSTLGSGNLTIAGLSEQQFSISALESVLNVTGTKPAYYSVSVQPTFSGYFQNVLYLPSDGTLTNLSTCANGVTADPANLSAVHSSTLGNLGFPSTLVINNTGATAESVTLRIYDANNGNQLGTYTSASIPAGGQAVTAVSMIETAAKIVPTSGMYHYVVEAQSPFTGFMQNLVNNEAVGVITDMTTACALAP